MFRVLRLCWLAFRAYRWPMPLKVKVVRHNCVTVRASIEDVVVPVIELNRCHLELAQAAWREGQDWQGRGKATLIEVTLTNSPLTFAYLSRKP